MTQWWPKEACSVPPPCQGCHSSTLLVLTTSEAEEASQGFRSLHGCHVSFCLIHIKVIPSTSAFSYAICRFLLSKSTCWDPNYCHIGQQGTDNFTGYFLCLSAAFYVLAFERIIYYYLSLCLLQIWVCLQAIYINCSCFDCMLNLHLLHVEVNVIHLCINKLCVSVCMQAS